MPVCYVRLYYACGGISGAWEGGLIASMKDFYDVAVTYLSEMHRKCCAASDQVIDSTPWALSINLTGVAMDPGSELAK